jgi:glycine/D-amino acid oxidase-like deaminating enzyme
VKEYPVWWDTLPALGAGSENLKPESEKLDQQVDVAIVGAGYTGLSAARRLARAGASVVVIDRGQAGWGASSRNGGQVLTGFRLDAGALTDRFGERRARQLFEIARESMTRLAAIVTELAIECGFERTGHLQAASKPSHFDAFRGEQALLARVFNHRVELVPASDQRSEIGSARYHGLLVDEASCGLNPAQYLQGLARAAIGAGARLSTENAVDRLERKGARWTVSTQAGTLDAGDVLVATNGYTGALSPGLSRRFVPIGSYVIATEPLSEPVLNQLLPRRRMAFDSKNFLHYFRLADGRLIFGGRAEFSQPNTGTIRRAAAILRRDMIDIFPELAATRIDYAWGGNVAFTRDQLPHAGRLDGMYYAGGYCGHGVAMATYLGELIARRMAGEAIDHPLVSDRFPSIPVYNGRPWFLPLVGLYYRMKDWMF